MSEAERRPFVQGAKQSQVADARAAGTSAAPYSGPVNPSDPELDPRRDENDYDDAVRRFRPLTWDVTELVIRISGQDLTFFEVQKPHGFDLCYPTLDFPVAQGEDHWMRFTGEQRFVTIDSSTYIFEVGVQYHGILFIDHVRGTVTYKVPEVKYRERYWGINREMPAAEFVKWLNYNPAPMMALAEFYEGAILGDAIKDPTLAHLAGQVATSFIPVVDQIADARDTIVALWTVASTRGREGKLMMAANIAAWVPFGDAVGLVPRIAKKLKAGDSITAIARQGDGRVAVLVRRGDEVVAMTDEAESVLAKQVPAKLLAKERAIERAVLCGSP